MNRLILISFLFIPVLLIAQKGPGGVSLEVGSQSTCRMWLDASTLSGLADGDDLTSWPDVSPSAFVEVALPRAGFLPPYFRDNAANAINGYPVVTFDGGRFLLLESSTDLNLIAVVHTKSVFFAFRSSTNITSKQVIYEEGGCWRGFNIHIENGFIFVGAYDFNDGGVNNNGNNPDNTDGTPQWGYTYVKKAIEPNTTYILSAQFYAKEEGVVANNADYYIKGWLNGNSMGAIHTDNDYALATPNYGIGTLNLNDNPIGIGAANDDYVDQTDTYCQNTGDFSFEGRLAEMIYYNDLLSESQRIIIENYLGAKYFANLYPINDKYAYQAYYGKDVIGIGQQTNVLGNNHNLSQGRNPFLISEKTLNTSANNHYFFTGHNGGNMVLTGNGVPRNSPSIRRLERIWRVDETGSFGEVQVQIHADSLPPKPPGFTKLVLLVDEASPNFPNFSLSTTVVKEVALQSGSNHKLDYNFSDGAFFTFAWLKPEVEFAISETSGLEADPSPNPTSPFSTVVNLNYIPTSASTVTVDYIFVDAGQTAEAADYQYDGVNQANGLNIPFPDVEASIHFDIVNDNIADNESTERFIIILQPGPHTTVGIGERDSLIFSILDDDPPPTGGFVSNTATVLETAGEYYVKFRRTGNSSDMGATSSEIRIRRKAEPNEGTASYNVDYKLLNTDGWTSAASSRRQEITFPAENVSSQLDSVRIEITDDRINEENEVINLTLEGLNGFAIASSSIINFELSIAEDDPLPQANFVVNNQTGYESVGDPAIAINLDRPSSRNVTVFYSINTSTSSATYSQDYTGTGITENGQVAFNSGDTLAFLGPFIVNADGNIDELPNTVVFELESAIHATLGAVNQAHTYTILDYSPFEWKGAAGVGKNSDNIVWVDATRMSPLGPKDGFNNFSPRNINILHAFGTASNADLIADGINNQQSIQFDGIDDGTNGDVYEIGQSSFINMAGSMEKKNYFFVIRPTAVPDVSVTDPNSSPSANQVRVLYEQGGIWRGLSIYLYNKRVYFQLWNDAGSHAADEEPHWGCSDLSTGTDQERLEKSVYAYSSQEIVAGEDYIVSCQFDSNSDEPIMIYVNGKKGIMCNKILADPAGSVGKLYNHTGNLIGGVDHKTLVHFTTKSIKDHRCGYEGLLSEIILFHEPQMNEARRTIIANYLSAKYNIPLASGDTRQVFDLTFADMNSDPSNDFNNEVAGVGKIQIGSESYYHGDAQGPSILRIQNPIFTQNTGFLEWGRNYVDLLNTFPHSYWNADLPGPIQERSGSVWKIFESPDGSIASADFYINFSASSNAVALSQNTTLLKLLTHPGSDPNPQDFSTATIHDAELINNGYIAYFKDVEVTNGMYFALANTSPINISPLPVSLLHFSAQLIGDYVDITWATASEWNNAYFEVERAGANLKWHSIAKVPGAGNSNTPLNYFEKDRTPLPGISYYRLKQVDYDGNFNYSDVVSVSNQGNYSNPSDILLFPNPSDKGSVFLEFSNPEEDESIHISIFTASGSLVYQTDVKTQAAPILIKYGEALKPGIYLFQILGKNYALTKKLIVN